MKTENHYTYRTEWSPEDNCYISRVLEFPSLSTFGDTRAEAEAELDIVVDSVLKWMTEEKEEIPVPLTEKEYKGNIALRVPPATHRNIAVLASNEGVSVNQFITSIIERNLYCDSMSAVISTIENKVKFYHDSIQKMTLINFEIFKRMSSLTSNPYAFQDEHVQNISSSFIYPSKMEEKQLII